MTFSFCQKPKYQICQLYPIHNSAFDKEVYLENILALEYFVLCDFLTIIRWLVTRDNAIVLIEASHHYKGPGSLTWRTGDGRNCLQKWCGIARLLTR